MHLVNYLCILSQSITTDGSSRMDILQNEQLNSEQCLHLPVVMQKFVH